MRFHFHSFFTGCLLIWVSTTVQAQSISGPKTLADEVKPYMQPIRQEMEEKMQYYAEKHSEEGLVLRGMALYTYGPQNELVEEKGCTLYGYSLTLYRNGRKTEYTYMADNRVSRERYDGDENLLEDHSYHTDRAYEKKETYRFETRTHATADTVTVLRYNNGQVDRRTVTINDSFAGKTLILLYYFDRAEPKSVREIVMTPDRKNIWRDTYSDRTGDYYSVSENTYSPQGLLLRSTDSSKYGKSEYLYFYNAQGWMEKCEYKNNGETEWWCQETYDAAGHLLKTSGFDKKGLKYMSEYEYDEKGNKRSYLYYYRVY